MKKRTTLEIDDELLDRAQRALGCPTKRETIETALRIAAEKAETDSEERRRRQIEYFQEILPRLGDLEVLKSGEMWR